MTLPAQYPGSFTTGINATDRPFVEPAESIGAPSDDRATSQNDTNSAFSLAKGIAHGLSVPEGSGVGVTVEDPDLYDDPLRTLGDRDDAAATDTGDHSAVAFLKGICRELGL